MYGIIQIGPKGIVQLGPKTGLTPDWDYIDTALVEIILFKK